MRQYLLNRKREKEKNLKYDFLPSLIEIVERPANKWGTVVIIVSLFLFLFAGIWSVMSKFDVVVSAAGMVMTEKDINRVETLISGTVSEIKVQEGEYVEEGDVLICLDSSEILDKVENLTKQIENLTVQKELYEKIENGEDVTELDTFIYEENKWTAKAIIEEEKLYRLNRKEYERQEKLAEDKEYISYQKQVYEQTHCSQTVKALAECMIQISQYEKEKKEYEKALEYYIIKADTSGYVTNLQVHYLGEELLAGDMISYIADTDKLIFECYVSDADIAEIMEGQKVQVKISTYPYNDYGVFEGEIASISDVSIQKDGYGNVYVTKVEMNNPQELSLSVGMSGSAEIVIGTRSALEYFLEPVTQGVNESFREK